MKIKKRILEKITVEDKTWEKLFSMGYIRKYSSGEVIYLQNEQSVGLVCLKKGKIKNSIYLPDGTEKTLCILEAPNITGETSVIDGGETICSAIALTEVEVIFISGEKARKVLLVNPELMFLLMDVMARKIRSMEIQAENVALNISKRLARMLLNPNKYGVYTHKDKEEQLIITHEELASFLGTTRPKITEYLNYFEQKGFIEKRRGCILIKDRKGLQNYLL